MNFYLLLVAILFFSTSIDLSEAASCYTRADTDIREGTEGTCDSPNKCYAYYDASGKNIGDCDNDGCNDPTGKRMCKECTGAKCNVRALIFRKCYLRESGTGATSEGVENTPCPDTPELECVSYYNTDGVNWGGCVSLGCGHSYITGNSLHCKECFTDNCNVRSLIRKCYGRNAGTTSGDGDETNCATTMTNPKCVSYYNADGKNIGECKDGGCGSQANCKECSGDNCNTRALAIRKCYLRESGADAASEGAENTACTGTNTPTAKCVSYYNADGKNLGKCLDGGCTHSSVSSLPCMHCTTDNCNVRSLVTTTAAPAAKTTLRAGATRASVGWQTGVMAASACVLALMKPF